MGGNGPLLEFASLVEYAELFKPTITNAVKKTRNLFTFKEY